MPAKVGARGSDSVTPINALHAQGLKNAGYDFCVRYLGSVTSEEIDAILNAGLAFMPVTFGGVYDGAVAAQRCKDLGIPEGTSVWLDVEGAGAFQTPAPQLTAKIDAWAQHVQAAGYMPCIYLGAPQPLTSTELTQLAVVRYWHGQGRCVDRNNQLAEPRSGFCMWQMWPSIVAAGVNIDANMIGADYQSRVPSWVVKG